MTKPDDGGPAFPNSLAADGPFGGMTLRQWYAGMALAGFASIEASVDKGKNETFDEAHLRYWRMIAKSAYIAADAMIAEGMKETGK